MREGELDTLVHHAVDYSHVNGTFAREWFAVYVRTRHEFIVHEELLRKKIDAFLPSVQRHRQWHDRRKVINYPLFPGYLFVNICPEPATLLSVLRTTGTVRILSSPNGKPISVAPEEISSLRLMVETGQDLNVYPSLKEGTRVRIKAGSLRGVEGVLVVKGNQHICVVNIGIFGRSVGIKIHAEDLEAL